MIISIASGKGGTGKTLVSTNLAQTIGYQAQILDCDVEEPNSHLFLKPEIFETREVIAPVPEIDTEKCTHCKKCMDICRFGAIAVVAKSVVTFPELCHSCGGCTAVCPENAVKEKKRSLGVIQEGWIKTSRVNGTADPGKEKRIKFVHGLMDIGQVMAPPIIRQVRTYTDPEKINIIDAPPGTSCPVITSMKGADLVVLVTEPTPFGLHDLTLAVEAVKLLGIPHGIIINRAGMGNDDVKAYAQREDIPILMEIPFDRRIAEAYSRGELIVSALPEYREKFSGLLERIKEIAEKRNSVQ
ncbi:ATP-binding protein [Desulfospira joergensenii]|uniref:ATP-binding protein n=1 Tax=Desulfospira joergensenii TaxID=53329 RepID=UPI0003B34617|nr:ATP-binding protein [Desulfospira joergensenii]